MEFKLSRDADPPWTISAQTSGPRCRCDVDRPRTIRINDARQGCAVAAKREAAPRTFELVVPKPLLSFLTVQPAVATVAAAPPVPASLRAEVEAATL